MGTKKPMLRERSDVRHALWRKKVDKSVFGHNGHGGTTIPRWMWPVWELEQAFGSCSSEKDPRSDAQVFFEGTQYEGHVTVAKQGRENTPACRLWFPDALCQRLRHTFPMSYMRSLERELTKSNRRDVEKEIPFWEFLDIEYDPDSHEFHLTAHYSHSPIFPRLFDHLIDAGVLNDIGEPDDD